MKPTIPISLDKWITHMGISRSTAWNWRKNGMLKTINICGRQYIMPDEQAEFMRRAASGEFARKRHLKKPDEEQ